MKVYRRHAPQRQLLLSLEQYVQRILELCRTFPIVPSAAVLSSDTAYIFPSWHAYKH